MIWNPRPVFLGIAFLMVAFALAQAAVSIRMSTNWDCVAVWMRRPAKIVSSFGVFKSHCLDVGYQYGE